MNIALATLLAVSVVANIVQFLRVKFGFEERIAHLKQTIKDNHQNYDTVRKWLDEEREKVHELRERLKPFAAHHEWRG